MENNIKVNSCNLHPKQEINLLRFHKDINQVLSCLTCVEQQDQMPGICTINLLKFLEADAQSFFSNWPPFDKESSQYLKSTLRDAFEQTKNGALLTEESISKYFQSFRVEVICKINTLEKKYISLLKTCGDYQLINEYNNISKKNEIKDIIIDYQIPIDKKNAKIKQIVDDVLQNTSKNTKKMMDLVSKYDLEKSLSLKQLEDVKRKINQYLDFHYTYLSNKFMNNYNIEILDKNKDQIQILSSIFRSQFNQCEDQFLDSLEQIITKNFYLFKDLFNERIFKVTKVKLKNALTEEQLYNILLLVQKISYNPADVTIEDERFKKTKTFCQYYLKESPQLKKIENTLIKYPIFEIDHFIENIQSDSINLKKYFIKVNLIQSDYKQSRKQSQIVNNNSLLVITQQNSQHSQMQAYVDFILDPDKKYVIKLELIQNKNRERLCFGFGLGQDSKLDDNLYEQKLMYHNRMNSWGISKILKGKSLSDKNISQFINEFEVEIYIKDNIFQVSDLPNRSCINSIESDNNILKEIKNFRFFVSFPSSSTFGDWIKVSSIQVVDNFN